MRTWVIWRLSWLPRRMNSRFGHRTYTNRGVSDYEMLSRDTNTTHLEGNKQGHAFYAVVAAVDVVAHEEVVCVGHLCEL